MKLVNGDQLSTFVLAQVKAGFTYRLTTENGYPGRNPCKASVPAISDAEWLKNHDFWVTNSGRLAKNRRYAEPRQEA